MNECHTKNSNNLSTYLGIVHKAIIMALASHGLSNI